MPCVCLLWDRRLLLLAYKQCAGLDDNKSWMQIYRLLLLVSSAHDIYIKAPYPTNQHVKIYSIIAYLELCIVLLAPNSLFYWSLLCSLFCFIQQNRRVLLLILSSLHFNCTVGSSLFSIISKFQLNFSLFFTPAYLTLNYSSFSLCLKLNCFLLCLKPNLTFSVY